jgi:hypothetical protein
MIIHQRHADSLVRKMEASHFNFYLTGSRFFGGHTPTSDWDYFADINAVGLIAFLESIGFQNDDVALDQQYDDVSIVRVFCYNDIHVQLVHNAILKNRVQNMLRDNVPMKALPKSERKHMWNFGFRVIMHHLGEFQK